VGSHAVTDHEIGTISSKLSDALLCRVDRRYSRWLRSELLCMCSELNKVSICYKCVLGETGLHLVTAFPCPKCREDALFHTQGTMARMVIVVRSQLDPLLFSARNKPYSVSPSYYNTTGNHIQYTEYMSVNTLSPCLVWPKEKVVLILLLPIY
jgi:hypothetical protein